MKIYYYGINPTWHSLKYNHFISNEMGWLNHSLWGTTDFILSFLMNYNFIILQR
jgi:hypothetical protein